MIEWLTLFCAAVAAFAATAAYVRSVRTDNTVRWHVERRGAEYVLVSDGPGVALDLRIELPEHNTAVAWGVLERDEVHPGSAVPIAQFMPRGTAHAAEVITVSWRSGRRRRSIRMPVVSTK